MTEKQFKQLLNKYQAGKCSPEEKKIIQEWYQSFENDEDGIHKLSQTEKEALEERITEKIRNQTSISAANRRVILFIPFLRTSVAALLVMTLGYFTWDWLKENVNKNQLTQVSSNGEIKKVMLSDGTIVWLKGNSQLEYPEKFDSQTNRREVYLAGEALFEVAKNASQPFFIHCGDIQAKVLGTSFNVKQTADQKKIEVVVLTGKVALVRNDKATDNGNATVVEPKQRAIFGSDGFSTTKIETLSAYTQGTEYDMQFDETPLKDVFERIEQKFNVEIAYEAATEACQITADLTDQSLATTLQMIMSVVEEASYKKEGQKILFEGKACQ